MELIRKNYLVDLLLGFMKHDIEQLGLNISSVYFDFMPSYREQCFGNTKAVVPDAEDLRKFKAISGASQEEFIEVFNYCLTNNYIMRCSLTCLYQVQLSYKGFLRAMDKEKEEILQHKLKNERIYITLTSEDKTLKPLLEEARKEFLEEEISKALKTLFEALKYLNKIKKKKPDFFEVEYKLLSAFNKKKAAKNADMQKYLFYRALALINLTISGFEKSSK